MEDVPPGVQATAYRVVQEGLTNALKHGPRSGVHVRVSTREEVLTVTVDDDGDGDHDGDHGGREPAPSRARAGGHGLRGLQGRVHLYGGTMQVGPRTSGWRVEASLPLAPGDSLAEDQVGPQRRAQREAAP